LLQNAETACDCQHPTSSDTSITKARNRRETRTVDVFSATRAVANTEWKHLIKGIVRVTREVLHRSAKTGLWSSASEVAYYLAGFVGSASHAGIAIRSHWHIENTLHYTRDVTFQEDQSRIRCNPAVFARIRSFGYNILRRQSGQNVQPGQIRRRSRRTRCAIQVECQLRALNSPVTPPPAPSVSTRPPPAAPPPPPRCAARACRPCCKRL
jgi:predicted transposase YbfD/YdcC